MRKQRSKSREKTVEHFAKKNRHYALICEKKTLASCINQEAELQRIAKALKL